SSRRRHTRCYRDWSSDVCSSDLFRSEMAKPRPDLKQYVGQKLSVIAWLWARTVKSPNPAFAQVDVPLASTFTLSTKAGKETYVRSEERRVGEERSRLEAATADTT